MKASSNFYRLVAVFALSLLPVTTLAQNNPVGAAVASAKQEIHTQNMCSRVNTFGQNALGNITRRTAKVQSDRSADANRLQQEESAVDTKVTADRAKWDQSRASQFTKLTAIAKTPVQQQAVSTFEQSVLADVATHRSAIDAARNIFRSALQQTISTRQTQQDQAFNAFTTSVKTAIAQADASCSTADPTGVAKTFTAAMKQARSTLQTTITGISKVNGTEQTLAATRTQSIKNADSAFQAAVKQAAQTLSSVIK